MELPEGAVRVHLYNSKNILRPRGSMEKESLSLYLKERLLDAFEYWSDPKYGDSLEPSKLHDLLHANLLDEMSIAMGEFSKEIAKRHPGAVKHLLDD